MEIVYSMNVGLEVTNIKVRRKVRSNLTSLAMLTVST
jgi:hypothetical protein